MRRQILDRARPIRLAIFDVDGVLTDGLLHYTARGEERKAFHILDGHGLRMLRATGLKLAILSGRKSPAVAIRAAELEFSHVVQGARDKLSAFRSLLRKARMSEPEVAFMGDDLPDLPVLTRCGLAITVPAAPRLVRQHAHYVTRCAGGNGAVREACELIMHAQGTLDQQVQFYMR
jgi:3-deoxy-D-manno-octulosonate 8-phosphate phosphatase (KDO 8-P phosphatase)